MNRKSGRGALDESVSNETKTTVLLIWTLAMIVYLAWPREKRRRRRKRPGPAPPAVWRIRGRWAALGAGGCLLLLVIDIAVPTAILNRDFGAWNLIQCVVLFGIVAFVDVQRRRWNQRLRNVDYEACLHCAYPLKGLPDLHRCPECGRAYRLYDVKLRWQHYLGV